MVKKFSEAVKDAHRVLRVKYPNERTYDASEVARVILERGKHRTILYVQGPLFPKRVKGRSKRGWTAPAP